jgi:hypothetical protein
MRLSVRTLRKDKILKGMGKGGSFTPAQTVDIFLTVELKKAFVLIFVAFLFSYFNLV